MEILKASPSDLLEILYLLRVCILDMNEKGMKQWNSAHPDRFLLKQVLEEGNIYVLKDKGVCKGMLSVSNEVPEDYKELLNGNNESGTLFIKWLAVHPIWKDKGIAKLLVDFAEEHARGKALNNIKLDALSSSEIAAEIVRSNSYTEVGKFHSAFQKVPFICYQKDLK